MKNLKTMIKSSAISLALLSSANAFADIQHLDDVIIKFSLCVGTDCVNGESFGFDTLRLKENNLRINFQDTSTSASFPTNDWRIVANDSSNGGANYLAIEDSNAGRIPFRVEAGARANALYVESDGDVGLGTSSPVVNLHVVDGNTPTLRLEQDGSSGFTPQTWDLAGNEANFFVRDATNGSKLPFKIKPSAPTSSIFVAADGDIGLGDESPDAALDVESGDVLITNGNLILKSITISDSSGVLNVPGPSHLGSSASSSQPNQWTTFAGSGLSNGTSSSFGNYGGFVLNSNQDFTANARQYLITNAFEADKFAIISSNNATSSPSLGDFGDINNGRADLTIDNNGNTTIFGSVNATAFNMPSDYRLKENISGIDNPLTRLASLAVRKYNYIERPNRVYEGFFAHDVAEIAPYAVSGTKNSIDESGKAVYQSVDYSKLVPLLTASVQELNGKIEELEAKLAKTQ